MSDEVEIEVYFPKGSHFGGQLVNEDKDWGTICYPS